MINSMSLLLKKWPNAAAYSRQKQEQTENIIGQEHVSSHWHHQHEGEKAQAPYDERDGADYRRAAPQAGGAGKHGVEPPRDHNRNGKGYARPIG